VRFLVFGSENCSVTPSDAHSQGRPILRGTARNIAAVYHCLLRYRSGTVWQAGHIVR
jgi:hypothetical protein